MHKPLLLLLFIILFCRLGEAQKKVQVLIQTEFGDIEAEIYLKKAPITSKNFLMYVDNNSFEEGTF
ncbi:MAG TPA: peptidylprolyl isomerase [Cytophagales bacterium]|nr:peptidylprolyl isomerase [Cytophagales bacterium]